ncbi:hypothetical protein Tco_1047634 [Tanacetum coccineum]
MYFERGVDRTKIITEKYVWFRLCGREHVHTLSEFVVLLGLYEPSELDDRLFVVHFSKLEIDDKLLGSKERCQKRDLWMMSALEESRDCKVVGEPCKWRVEKCSEPIECEKWTTKMLENELDLDNQTLLRSTLLPQPPRVAMEQRQEPSGLKSSWDDWNTNLNEIEHRDVWRDSILMRNNYMLEHSIPILHHLADQANFAYPTYEPPNVPSYPYPYMPYPHTYMHYPDVGNQSHGGEHNRAPGDGYFTRSMTNFRGTTIVLGSSYEIGGSSRAMQEDDVDDSMSEQRVHTDDD